MRAVAKNRSTEGMARKLIKRWLPDNGSVKNSPTLKFFGKLLHDPNLFHLNRHSVSAGAAIGIFVALQPIIGQMPLAALLALWFRGNLPLALSLTWLTNPFTYAPVYFSTYELGRWILDMPRVSLQPEWSLEWVQREFHAIWKPLFAGSLVAGLLLGILSYFAMRAFWYWTVMRSWHKRIRDRAQRQLHNASSN